VTVDSAIQGLGRDTGPAMSQENVEAARRAYEAFNRRDLDALLAVMDAEVEFSTRLVGAGSYRGHDGVRLWWDDLLRVFPDFTVEVTDVDELDDLTINAVRVRGHGMDSETPFEENIWQVGKWRNGKAVSWGSYASRREAREAARALE
jgi:ketosteroid isomerase-like protein